MRFLTSIPPCSSYSYSSSCFWFLIVLALCRCYLSLENSNKVLCIEKERVALLQFKDDLEYGGAGLLNSWDEENDCCKWGGIVCNNFTGHVEQIRLRGPDRFDMHVEPRYGSIQAPYESFMKNLGYKERDGEILRGKINPSLQHLRQLEYLDLSCNDFGMIKIPGHLGSLRNLRYLNISNSLFSREIPHQLGNLSRLNVLGLSNDLLSASNLQWLSRLSMLQHLDMNGVDLSTTSDWLQVINTLPSLVELHLSRCYLNQSPLPLTSINLTSLSVLDLSSNFFPNATVPGWIFNVTSLVSLDLSNCLFQAPTSRSSNGFNGMTILQTLDVSGNDFVKTSWFVKGLSSVSSTLISLVIGNSGLSSSLISGLGNMSSLVRLDLSGNKLNKTIPESLGNLCDLKQIDLSRNNFGGVSLSEILNNFFKCESPKLESLRASSSNISGHLPNQIEQLDKLANLQLRENSISGSIPSLVGALSSLEVLDLSYNLFSGAITDFIGGLISLKQLDLSNNQLNGSIPESIGQILNLEYLNIGNNFLTGFVTENHFTNLTKLKQFSANGNILTLRPHLVDWIPPFQLLVLQLSSWNLGPQFPSWVQLQSDLINLDVSSLRIPYPIPKWVWTVSSCLRFLNLSHNEIHGKLVTRIPASLYSLDLNSINFRGPLPELSNNSEIYYLDLSNNSFCGSLEHLLCPVIQSTNLIFYLNLADNDLSGEIPKCWKRWKILLFLNLENNNLFGRIPKSLGYLSNLLSLNLRNNKLSGQLPASLVNLTSLQLLQLGENEFSGTIPTWIAGLTGLMLLDLRSNNFVGDMPYELCQITSIQILDLAHNNLTGVIPSCFSNFSIMSGTDFSPQSNSIRIIDLFWSTSERDLIGRASLVMKGREDTYSNILGLVTMLDLSGNSFSGHIPMELTRLMGLMSMNLSRNYLTGRIPGNIGDMNSLESLDLSLNQLDGEIPLSLAGLTFLSRLNLSFNHLTGSIPTSTQLQTFENSSFIGNMLCGLPLMKRCPVATPIDRGGEEVVKNDSEGSHEVYWGLIISIMLGFVVGFWVVVGPLVVSNSWRTAYFRILNKARFLICNVDN